MSVINNIYVEKGENDMLKYLALSLVILAVFYGNVMAQDKGLGLGVILGEPTGVCFKLWVDHNIAVDGGAAWSFGKHGAWDTHIDLLLHNFKGKFRTYYGIGGRIKFLDDRKVGIRVPIGVTYILTNSPYDVFFEIIPILDFSPKTNGGLNGAIGVRYYLFQ